MKLAILQQVAMAYASCRSFSCEAHMTRYFHTANPRRVRYTASIRFKRPDQIKIEWAKEPYRKRNNHYCIIGNGETIIRYEPGEQKWNQERSILMAIAADAGISGGLAHFVPLLLVRYPLFRRILKISHEKQLSYRDPHRFWIDCRYRGSEHIQLLIEKEDFSILEVREYSSISTGEVEQVTRYRRIVWNPELKSADFTPSRVPIFSQPKW